MLDRSVIKPPALKRGDTIGVIAPAAAVERSYLDTGLQVLRDGGFRVKLGRHVLSKDRVLAGRDTDRAADLEEMFADPQVKAILAARGGYGSGRLLPMLDFEKLAATPKIYAGYSDHTFLLNALFQRIGLICFHAPVVAKDLAQGVSSASLIHLWRLLSGELCGFELTGTKTVHPGIAEGELIGGCLSILTAMLGTPYMPEFAGRILFLEDTGEKAYRIDRMLVQLRQAGALDQVAGVVIGGMAAPGGSIVEQELIGQFVAEQTGTIPVLSGIPAGHGTENFALPIGVRARLDAGARRLEILEAAVSVS